MNLQITANDTVQYTWARLIKLYPQLTKPCPIVVLNARLKTTAGRCFYELRKVDLSTELFTEYPEQFVLDTIPHELAHQVAWDLWQHPGHLDPWKTVMRALGLDPRRTHSMTNTVHHAKKAGVR